MWVSDPIFITQLQYDPVETGVQADCFNLLFTGKTEYGPSVYKT